MNTIRELKQQEKYKSMLKRKNKELRELKDQLQQKENIIKEVREYIKENCIDDEFEVNLTFKERNIKKVLEILDKENK